MANKGQFTSWQALAEALRDELRECAWLMSLLDRQQKAILARDAGSLVEVNELILEQSGQVGSARDARLSLMTAICGGSIPAGFMLKDLAPLMPEVVQPLFEALAREAVALRKRIRRRTIQNHRMLERAATVTSELLEVVRPASMTRTYGRGGNHRVSSGLSGSMIHTSV
ncbi:MAG TPA: flagellar protein FlgN [Opitutales bacterium]|nr:flagellar protein FlgN [Opitutales bacterium]